MGAFLFLSKASELVLRAFCLQVDTSKTKLLKIRPGKI